MVFVFGALCIGFAILASQLGDVLQASLTALGLVGGPLLGIFSLGMTFPCANSWVRISQSTAMLPASLMFPWYFSNPLSIRKLVPYFDLPYIGLNRF